MQQEDLKFLLNNIFTEKSLIKCILSSPEKLKKQGPEKISIQPVWIKKKILYQITEHFPHQVKHRNTTSEECSEFLVDEVEKKFRQIDLYTTVADYRLLISRKKNISLIKKPPTMISQEVSHNKIKKYIMPDGIPVPFLIELGVMGKDGKVYAKKYDKFRQVNRFLELVADILPHLKKEQKLRIVDFGCGKSYLTFALYHLLHNVHGYEVHLVGLDLKKEVIEFCQKTAEKLSFKNLTFTVGDINSHIPNEKVDMVVTLHACDTATDSALEKAVRWDADVIMSVPCCQHELFSQIKSEELKPLLTHGILKERFTALVTDAARCNILKLLGYQTQLIEFIDMEHTAKNLLIRAIRAKVKSNLMEDAQAYLLFKKSLQITPSLEKKFAQELDTLFKKIPIHSLSTIPE
jgi:SAM-dependent methyltransferase